MRPHPRASRFSKRGTLLPSSEERGEEACGVGCERWRPDARVKIAALANAALQLRLAGGTQRARNSSDRRGPPRDRGGVQPPTAMRRPAGTKPGTGLAYRQIRSASEVGSSALGERIQLDTPRCSDMLTTPETFEISRGFESSARCIGRGRPASRVAGESGFRDPNPASGSDEIRVGPPPYLHMSAATRNALATEWQRTDEYFMGGAVSKAARVCNSHAQRSERRWNPRSRTQIGGGTSLAAHTERMVPRRRVEPLSEERVR